MNAVIREARWTIDSGGEWLCLKIDDHNTTLKACELIKEKPCDIDISPQKKRRSLDANAYAWVLFGKIANVLNIPKEEVYRELVRDIGDNYTIVPVREDAIERWCELWSHNGVGWFCENIGKCKRTEGYHNLMCYHGSSTYDSFQMGKLIDSAVELCHTYEIETMPPAELEALKERWT